MSLPEPPIARAFSTPSPLSLAVSQAPIGIFDSGLGGLSVLREIAARMPGESLIYIADSLHAPYGEKSSDFIIARSFAICDWLLAQGAKALVVACNTATAHAISVLRARYPQIPLIGVEPGLKPAAALSRNKIVGVLATERTLASEKFQRLLQLHANDCTYLCQAGRGLVPLIESGDTNSPHVQELLHRYLSPMLSSGADTLVLGCTHYPFLIPTIRQLAGETLQLIDTGDAIARQLQRKLAETGLSSTAATGSLQLYTTLQNTPYQPAIEKLVPFPAEMMALTL